MNTAFGAIMEAGACADLKAYIEKLLLGDDFLIDDALTSYNDPLGWHSTSHSYPDVALGYYHVNNDSYLEVARTMVHEAAHHVYGAGEADAETYAQGCVA